VHRASVRAVLSKRCSISENDSGFESSRESYDDPVSGSAGDYFWAGIDGTYFGVDPQEKLFGVMMVQMPFEQSGYYLRAVRGIVYGALEAHHLSVKVE
jgi:CubicO group peptidase (beta-lactamase class C family)